MGCCRWVGGSPPEGEPHPLIVRTIASSLPCALWRTWMPAFAGMTEGDASVRWGWRGASGGSRTAPTSERGRGSRLHGNDGGNRPVPRHPHPSLLPSREKGPEPSRGTTVGMRGLSLDTSREWPQVNPQNRAHHRLLPTVCAVAHLDASLRWHDGGGCERTLGVA